jgi:hypothetical protein
VFKGTQPIEPTASRPGRADSVRYRETWFLTPIVGIAEKHLMTFRDFPVRQLGLSAQMGKTIEDIQSQILKIKKSQ